MKAILSFLSHPRTRTLRRLPAPLVWVTALAVLITQGVGPSYAGIAVSAFGSSAIVRLSVLDWANGVPTRVAAYLPGQAQPVVRTIDPELVRSAVWTETGTEGAWRQARVTIPGMPENGTYDVAYRGDGAGLEMFATPDGNPEGALHLQADGEPSVQTPDFWPYLAALLTCALINDVMQQRCLGQAQGTCGKNNVKCANFSGFCGFGSCTVQCKGSPDSCN